jgi:hypothetical protein
VTVGLSLSGSGRVAAKLRKLGMRAAEEKAAVSRSAEATRVALAVNAAVLTEAVLALRI